MKGVLEALLNSKMLYDKSYPKDQNPLIRRSQCKHNIGTMRSLIEGPLNRGESEVHLKEVITNNGWDLANFSFDFPNPILKVVMATPLRRYATREDHKSWISSLNGEFDPKNTYLLAVDENLEAPDFHGKRIWKLQTLPKIQFFLWKCLHPSLLVKSILA